MKKTNITANDLMNSQLAELGYFLSPEPDSNIELQEVEDDSTYSVVSIESGETVANVLRGDYMRICKIFNVSAKHFAEILIKGNRTDTGDIENELLMAD